MHYYSALERIRYEFAQNFDDFPNGKCYISDYAAKLIPDLDAVFGAFVPLNWQHCWNFDRERDLFVDLTMDQFAAVMSLKHPYLAASINNEITILPASTNLLQICKENQ